MKRRGSSHILRHLNAEHVESPLQLGSEIVRHPQKEGLLFGIRLGEDGELVVEIAEGLRELERVASHVGGLAARHRALDSGTRLRCREQKLPAVFRLELPSHGFTRKRLAEIREAFAALG